MPAPETTPQPHELGKTLGHVNLMVDTLIANATVEDLRAIVRNLLATGSPLLASAFTSAARARLNQTSARRLVDTQLLFQKDLVTGFAYPAPQLDDVLARARSLYGAGMGFASLRILASVVRATLGCRWKDESEMSNVLAIIDADISQAIQSCREELEGGRVGDLAHAREAIGDLTCSVKESLEDVETWGGEFPFDRGASSMEYWKF